MFFANFALSHSVDDHEVCGVSVSLFTVQLRCAFVHVRHLVFGTGATLFQARLFYGRELVA